jgi:hypothetical protein
MCTRCCATRWSCISPARGSTWGFLPDPATGQTHLALEEAQIAIDCADFLAGKLKPRLEPEEQREYERRLRDLKLNFLAKQNDTRTEA